MKHGMYPSFGIEGYNPDGSRSLDRKPHDISRFNQDEIRAQHRGIPVVWADSDSTFASAFQRVLARTIGWAIIHDEVCSARLKEAFRAFWEKQEAKEVSKFAKKWADEFYGLYKDLAIENRPNNLESPYYRLDYVDMFLAIASIRYSFNNKRPGNGSLKYKIGFQYNYQSKFPVLILDPTTSDVSVQTHPNLFVSWAPK